MNLFRRGQANVKVSCDWKLQLHGKSYERDSEAIPPIELVNKILAKEDHPIFFNKWYNGRQKNNQLWQIVTHSDTENDGYTRMHIKCF